jgi:hypothetical protein
MWCSSITFVISLLLVSSITTHRHYNNNTHEPRQLFRNVRARVDNEERTVFWGCVLRIASMTAERQAGSQFGGKQVRELRGIAQHTSLLDFQQRHHDCGLVASQTTTAFYLFYLFRKNSVFVWRLGAEVADVCGFGSVWGQ